MTQRDPYDRLASRAPAEAVVSDAELLLASEHFHNLVDSTLQSHSDHVNKYQYKLPFATEALFMLLPLTESSYLDISIRRIESPTGGPPHSRKILIVEFGEDRRFLRNITYSLAPQDTKVFRHDSSRPSPQMQELLIAEDTRVADQLENTPMLEILDEQLKAYRERQLQFEANKELASHMGTDRISIGFDEADLLAQLLAMADPIKRVGSTD